MLPINIDTPPFLSRRTPRTAECFFAAPRMVFQFPLFRQWWHHDISFNFRGFSMESSGRTIQWKDLFCNESKILLKAGVLWRSCGTSRSSQNYNRHCNLQSLSHIEILIVLIEKSGKDRQYFCRRHPRESFATPRVALCPIASSGVI